MVKISNQLSQFYPIFFLTFSDCLTDFFNINKNNIILVFNHKKILFTAKHNELKLLPAKHFKTLTLGHVNVFHSWRAFLEYLILLLAELIFRSCGQEVNPMLLCTVVWEERQDTWKFYECLDLGALEGMTYWKSDIPKEWEIRDEFQWSDTNNVVPTV